VVSKPQIMFESKASRELKTESATHSGGWVFQFAGQRSYRTLDGVLKSLLSNCHCFIKKQSRRQSIISTPAPISKVAPDSRF